MRLKSFVILLALACAAVCPAVAGQDDSLSTESPFDGPLKVPGTPFIIIAGEDRASPFTSAHSMEEDRYAGLYSSHYHGLFYRVNEPVLVVLPSATDKQGRPLWFDGASGDAALGNLVTGLLNRGQTADLDRLFDDWNDPTERMADGRWKLSIFYKALSDEFSNGIAWDPVIAFISNWRHKEPKSRAAALSEVIYWYAYAWNARGTGYIGSVTPEGWKLFRQRLVKAQSVLEDSKSFAASSPLWTRLYIDVGIALELPGAELKKVFEQGVQSQRYFSPIYTGMVSSLTPKWGGSWQAVDKFVEEAVKDTPAEGTSLYARIYWHVYNDQESTFDLFRDSLATWPQMKRGFEDMVRLYPHSASNMNDFAAAACMAGDKATFQSLRFLLGKNVMPDAWPTNYSLDMCEHKFALQPL